MSVNLYVLHGSTTTDINIMAGKQTHIDTHNTRSVTSALPAYRGWGGGLGMGLWYLHSLTHTYTGFLYHTSNNT